MLLSLRHDHRVLLVLLIRDQYARLCLLRGVLHEQPRLNENQETYKEGWILQNILREPVQNV